MKFNLGKTEALLDKNNSELPQKDNLISSPSSPAVTSFVFIYMLIYLY